MTTPTLSQLGEMTDDSANLVIEGRMERVLSFAYRGIHHVRKIKKQSATRWEVSMPDGISTFDFDTLTRLVIAAHKYAVRVSIHASGPRLVKIVLCARKRQGDIYERHPTIEEAIKTLTP